MKKLPSEFHNDQLSFKKDLGKDGLGGPVFVGQHYYYFGDRRIPFPDKFNAIVRRRQGIKYTEGRLAAGFVQWLKQHHRPGLIGCPLDQPNRLRNCRGKAAGISGKRDAAFRSCNKPLKGNAGSLKE
jgi:hypothetical protein